VVVDFNGKTQSRYIRRNAKNNTWKSYLRTSGKASTMVAKQKNHPKLQDKNAVLFCRIC